MTKDISDKLVYVGKSSEEARRACNLIREFWKLKPNTLVSVRQSSDATIIFPDAKLRELFEILLDREGIEYTNEAPKEETKQLAKKSYSGGQFKNECAQTGFIGNYKSVDEVIAADQAELNEIGGSFEAIGRRMEYLIGKIENELSRKKEKERENIFKKFDYNHTELLFVKGKLDDLTTERGKIYQELEKIFGKPRLIPGEKLINLVKTELNRGSIDCPFAECNNSQGSTCVYTIQNIKTGKEVAINIMTTHLAKEHHLLEKGNEYGITAKEFYKYFMSKRAINL